jgi:hypothetical protein
MLKQDIQLQRLLLVADKDANKSRSFKFCIVLTKNLQMAQDLSQMTADQFFKALKTKAFSHDYHGMYFMKEFSVNPGKKLPELKMIRVVSMSVGTSLQTCNNPRVIIEFAFPRLPKLW